MPTKMCDYVYKSCVSKVKHSSEASVKRAVDRSSYVNLTYYHCKICKGWHLTSKR